MLFVNFSDRSNKASIILRADKIVAYVEDYNLDGYSLGGTVYLDDGSKYDIYESPESFHDKMVVIHNTLNRK